MEFDLPGFENEEVIRLRSGVSGKESIEVFEARTM